MWSEIANLNDFILILQNRHEWDVVLIFVAFSIVFWGLFSLLLVQLLPKKYAIYQKQIVIFMVVVNTGLLFMGILFTLVMFAFGISWATYRFSRPNYEVMDFEEYYAKLPIINSEFHEGILDISTHGHWSNISPMEKIKSLKILYESKERNNIERIKSFLSDSSEETRLYAFSLVSTYEKKLNDNLKKLQKLFNNATEKAQINYYAYQLAETYWQFIYHGVADGHLVGFYTQKIEKVLQQSQSNEKVSLLLGKIYLHNREFAIAKEHFEKALEQGMPPHFINPFLAEIAYEQRRFNSVVNYMICQEHGVNLKMKFICQVWSE